MKKALFLLAVILLPLLTKAQNESATSTPNLSSLYNNANQENKQYYLYTIVTFDLSKDKKIKVDVDNGVEVKRLKNSKGDIKFKTRAAVLMYFIDKGWEPLSISSSTEVSGAMGTVGSDSKGFWLFRKPCTKEEFETILNQGIK